MGSFRTSLFLNHHDFSESTESKETKALWMRWQVSGTPLLGLSSTQGRAEVNVTCQVALGGSFLSTSSVQSGQLFSHTHVRHCPVTEEKGTHKKKNSLRILGKRNGTLHGPFEPSWTEAELRSCQARSTTWNCRWLSCRCTSWMMCAGQPRC